MAHGSLQTVRSVASPELYSMADLARRFSLPESTLRYYCRRFAPFFPVEGKGRRRRYTAKSIEILEFILNAMPMARTAGNLEKMLREKFDGAADCCNSISSVEELLQLRERDLARIEKELQALRQLIVSSERTQQEDLEQLRQWMGHFLKHTGNG